MISGIRKIIIKFRDKYIDNDILYDLLDFFIKPLTFFIILKKNIKNFFYWGWKLREDRNWDYSYLYNILYFKVKQKYLYFSNSNIGNWTSSTSDKSDNDEYRHFKALRICYKILKRIHESRYNSYQDKLDKMFGELKFIVDENKKFLIKREKETEENSEQIVKSCCEMRKTSQSMYYRDKKILFNLIEKHIEYWWD